MSTSVRRFIQIKFKNSWKTVIFLPGGGWKLREILDDEELIHNSAPEGIKEEQYCTYATIDGKDLENLASKYHEEAVRKAQKNGSDTRFDEILSILKNEPQKDVEDSNEWRKEDMEDAIYASELIAAEDAIARMVARQHAVYSDNNYRVVYEIS